MSLCCFNYYQGIMTVYNKEICVQLAVPTCVTSLEENHSENNRQFRIIVIQDVSNSLHPSHFASGLAYYEPPGNTKNR